MKGASTMRSLVDPLSKNAVFTNSPGCVVVATIVSVNSPPSGKMIGPGHVTVLLVAVQGGALPPEVTLWDTESIRNPSGMTSQIKLEDGHDVEHPP